MYFHLFEGKKADGKPWYHAMISSKTSKAEKTPSENDKRTIRRLAMGFFLDGEILYKKKEGDFVLKLKVCQRSRGPI